MENVEMVDIHSISAQQFYTLIERNREHIAKTFPRTLEACTGFEATKAFINNNIKKQQDKEGYFFYLRNTLTGNLIGYIVIKNIDLHIQKCELGYFIDKNYQGRGITSKTVASAVDYCFGTLKMNKVYICTSTQNIASQKVALNNGFLQEGVLKQEFKNGLGVLEDVVYFGLVKSEYNER